MSHRFGPRSFVVIALLLLLLVLSLAVASVYAKPDKKGGPHKYGQVTVTDVESLGMVVFPTGTMFDGTEVGGLSGITYDARRGVYYALSDDRSETNPSRYYSVDIDVSDGSLDDGDVTFVDVTTLRDHTGNEYGLRAIDPEGIELLNPGQLYISTEGEEDSTDPFVDRFNPAGKQNRALPVPDKFLYSEPGNFVRDNLGFESLTSTPNRRYLVTATENALENDGPISTLATESPSRVLLFDARKKRPMDEYIYCVGTIPVPPVPPDEFADHGLVEMEALDNSGTFLAMERSFAVGVGNTILLYETSTSGAMDVSGYDVLPADWGGCDAPKIDVMDKRLLANFEADLGIDPDNLEGMGFGPMLPDGRYLLIVVSDNNFRSSQETQFIALAVTLEAVDN